jgi:hypothetical protein
MAASVTLTNADTRVAGRSKAVSAIVSARKASPNQLQNPLFRCPSSPCNASRGKDVEEEGGAAGAIATSSVKERPMAGRRPLLPKCQASPLPRGHHVQSRSHLRLRRSQ